MAKKDIGGKFSFYLTEPNYVNPGKSKQIRGYRRNRYEGVAVSRPFPGSLDLRVKGKKNPVRMKKSFLKRLK